MTISDLHTLINKNESKKQNRCSGVQRMITECRKAGVPEPAYHITADAVVIAFARSNDENHTGSAQDEPKNGTNEDSQMSLKNDHKNEPKNVVKKEEKRANRRASILRIIQANPLISQAELAKLLNVSRLPSAETCNRYHPLCFILVLPMEDNGNSSTRTTNAPIAMTVGIMQPYVFIIEMLLEALS